MIDYQKHRENLSKAVKIKNWYYAWNGLDEPQIIEGSYIAASLSNKDKANMIIELVNDATELIDKAEKWDKVNEGLTVDGIHTSKGILGELYELREKREILENIIEKINAMAARDLPPSMSQRIIDICSEAIEDPATVEEGKQ